MNCPVSPRWSAPLASAATLSLLLAPLSFGQTTTPGIRPGETSVVVTLKRLNEPAVDFRVAGGPAASSMLVRKVPVQFVSDEVQQAQVLEEGPVHEAFAEPVSASVEQGEVVTKEPPQPINETPPEYRPEGENVEWIPGYWTWLDDKNDFVWVSGVWRSIPPGRAWTPGHWSQVDGGYLWVSGFWSDVTAQEVQYLPLPPESLEQGPSSAAPTENHFWIPGNWVWEQQQYNWRPGYWYPGQQGWMWVPDHYVYTPGGAVLVNGYWDYPLQQRGLLYAPVYWNGGYRYGAGYAYTPNRVVNTALLLSSLFIDNNRGYYYYGRGYASRDRYRPWYDSGRRGYYSPLYGFYSWQYGRDSNNWKDRFDHDHRRGDDFRDRRDDSHYNGRYALVGSVDDLKRSFDDQRRDDRRGNRERWNSDFRRLSDNERRDALDRSRQMEQFRNARNEFESKQRDATRAQFSRSDNNPDRRKANAKVPDDFKPSTFRLQTSSGAEDLRRQSRERYQQYQQRVMRQDLDNRERGEERRDVNRERSEANRDFQRQVEQSQKRHQEQLERFQNQQREQRDRIRQMQEQQRGRASERQNENRNLRKPEVPQNRGSEARGNLGSNRGPGNAQGNNPSRRSSPPPQARGNSGGNRGPSEARGNSNRGNRGNSGNSGNRGGNKGGGGGGNKGGKK